MPRTTQKFFAFFRQLTVGGFVYSVLLSAAVSGAQTEKPLGYQDTPILPDTKWHVHDGERPQPVVVQPGPGGFTQPPADAEVLFDGTHLSKWRSGDKPAHWQIQDGYMEVRRGGGIQTVQSFTDFQLHLEWASPKEVQGQSQGRGNSGVFLQGRYELQILDSFRNPTYPDGQAAALYGQYPPDVNACRPPGEWQSYDIFYTAPRFADGQLVSPAFVTVLHNGILVHHHRAFLGGTAHRTLPKYGEHGAGPIQLQDHGNPVRFRNIWIRPLNTNQD